jgi:hypothetical protein
MKQDKQRTDNVILRSVRLTTLAVEKKYLLHIPRVCVFVALGTQREMRKSNAKISEKITLYKMCVLIFYKNFLNISHSKKNRTRYDQKCVTVFM